MRLGRTPGRREGIQGAAGACEASWRDGKNRRILSWPWNLKKSERGFDALLDRSGGAGIARRAWMLHWAGASTEPAPTAPGVLGQGGKQKASPRTRHLTIPDFMRFTLAVASVSLLCLFALSSRISDAPVGSRSGLWPSPAGEVSSDGALVRGLTASGGMDVPGRRHGRGTGEMVMETAGRSWEERLARIGNGDSYVEVMNAGVAVTLPKALNVTLWEDSGVVYNDPKKPLGRYARGLEPAGGALEETDGDGKEAAEEDSTTDSFLNYQKPSVPAAIASSGLRLDTIGAEARCPSGHIRVLIAVVSRCCGSLAFTNRDAIRKTWMKGLNNDYPEYLDARFFIAQPPTPKQYADSYNALRGEVKLYNDIVVLPGKEDYLELPRKSIQVLQYAVESPCNYTHVMKIDDDCYLRGDNLMKMIGEGHKAKGESKTEVPWMHKMYVGQLQGAWQGEWMGFYPDRDPQSKWYLTEEELPDEVAPIGMTYLLGWGYMMSRDIAEHAVQRAANYTASPEGRPLWWALLPWEDTVVGALVADKVDWNNFWGFKSAWNGCSTDTVVKHLDIDAPEYQYHLYHDEVSGKWSDSTVKCSTGEGEFEIDDYDGWRIWRDTLPDVAWSEH